MGLIWFDYFHWRLMAVTSSHPLVTLDLRPRCRHRQRERQQCTSFLTQNLNMDLERLHAIFTYIFVDVYGK